MVRYPIRVLLVEDSIIVITILKRLLTSTSEIEVVGTANTGKAALAIIPTLLPDVICTDLHMPEMNGLEFTREVMATYPKPILVISAAVQEENTQNVFQLLQAGAVDIFPKPRAGLAADYERAQQELITKIKVLAGVTVFTQHRRRESVAGNTILETKKENPFPTTSSPSPNFQTQTSTPQVVVIGASTGGPQALHTIFSQLPANFPVPIICIQHISEGFLQGLVDWLAIKSLMPVKIALSGELPQPGTIYFAPEQRHLQFDSQGRFLYVNSPPLGGHRPSITVTFNAVANVYNRAAIAILLTGMGRDGADGMDTIRRAGGVTIAQDEASCVVFGMPKEAIALHAAQYILSINAIAPMLLNRFNLTEKVNDSPPKPHFWF